MSKPTFVERMAELGLNFPPDEIAAFEAFVGDLEQSAAALRAIELISKPWHPRAVFDTIDPAALWVVKRAGRTPAEAVTLTQAVGAIVAASDGLRRKLA